MNNMRIEQCYPPAIWGHQNYDADTCDIVEEQPQMQEFPSSVLTQTSSSSPTVVSHSFFTKKIDSDRTEQSLVQLEQIPIKKFAQPFVVAQNSNNTFIRMRDGSLLILENTNAKQVHDFLVSKAYKTLNLTPPSSSNTLTLYMCAGHAFLGLDCTSCDDGNPYHETFGLYPSFIEGKGVIQDEKDLGLHHATNPNFQAAFPITDEQALSVMNKKKSEEDAAKHSIECNNL